MNTERIDQFEIDFGARLLALAERAADAGPPPDSVLQAQLAAAFNFAALRCGATWLDVVQLLRATADGIEADALAQRQ